MPTIKGYTAEEAEKMLTDAGFTNFSVEYDDHIEAGKDEVVRQNPLQGSVIPSDYKINIICSKGENPTKTQTIYVDLPNNVASEVRMTVLVDGALDQENTKIVIPAYSPTFTLKIKAKDKITVLVLLDDEKYREYTVEYDTGYVETVNAYPYSGAATEPPADETITVDEPEDGGYEDTDE
jgi:hypothetical protein